MDDKQSSLREQLVTTKEALNRATLDKEIMEAEKAEVVDALCKVIYIFVLILMENFIEKCSS